jgi:hypothetical protein
MEVCLNIDIPNIYVLGTHWDGWLKLVHYYVKFSYNLELVVQLMKKNVSVRVDSHYASVSGSSKGCTTFLRFQRIRHAYKFRHMGRGNDKRRRRRIRRGWMIGR